MAPKKHTDWTIFIAKFRTENKEMAYIDVFVNAGVAWGKLSDAEKKEAVKGSLKSDWLNFLAEFRTKNKGKNLTDASEAWQKLTDAQKAAYGSKKDAPKKNAPKKDASKNDAAKKEATKK